MLAIGPHTGSDFMLYRNGCWIACGGSILGERFVYMGEVGTALRGLGLGDSHLTEMGGGEEAAKCVWIVLCVVDGKP